MGQLRNNNHRQIFPRTCCFICFSWWTSQAIFGLLINLLLCQLTLARKIEVTFRLPEESPVGTEIGDIRQKMLSFGQMSATDLDGFQFQFLGENRYFRLDQTKGKIFVKSRIDREGLCSEANACCSPTKYCTLAAFVLDVAGSGSSDQTILDIIFQIKDINDNTPNWQNKYINLDIPEHTPVGSRFRLPTAKDPDQGPRNTTVRYAIKTQSPPGMFSLEQSELNSSPMQAKQFKLWLQVDQDLDREARANYQVTISAYDGGNPSRTGSVVVNITVSDINDHPPVFQNPTQEVRVVENLPVNKEIFQAKANDPDPSDASRLKYRMGSSASDDVQKYFRVDSKTGAVYLTGILDYEKTSQPYQIPITVTDGKHISDTNLIVHVINENDNSPTIDVRSHLMRGNGEVWIRENLDPKQLVATITVTDADDRQQKDIVKCQTNNRIFAIEPLFKGSNNRLKLVTVVKFDKEQKSEYYVTIECWDSGQPSRSSKKSLKVNIDDENDSPPVFTQPIYFTKLQENAPFNSTVTTVTATDRDTGKNREIRYSLDNFSQANFAIDPRTGVITTRTIFDREQIGQVNITVIAKDRGFVPVTEEDDSSDKKVKTTPEPVNRATSFVIVDIIDINDCAPRFERSSYEFSVDEGERIHHVIDRIVARDDDVEHRNNQLRYSMVTTPGDDIAASYFGVSRNGEIYVRSSQIDREKTPVATFKVLAEDSGSPPQSNTVNVIIRINDINDHSPVFTFPRDGSRTANISYELTVGHKVAEIKATDLDYGPRAAILYSIISGNEYDLFQLDSTSGFLYLAKALTKKEIRMHKLFLKAMDQGKSPRMSTSVLDINVLGSSVYLTQNGHPMEKDLIIMICMIAVTLVISVVLIAAIIFLRCVRCRPFFKRSPSYPRTRICFPDGRSSPTLSEIPHLCKQQSGMMGSPMLSRLTSVGTIGGGDHHQLTLMDRDRPPLYYTMESKMSMLGDTDSLDSGRSGPVGGTGGTLKFSGLERANTLGRMPQVHYFNKDCSSTMTKSIDSKRLDATSTMPRLATFRAATMAIGRTDGGKISRGGELTQASTAETPRILRGSGGSGGAGVLSVSWMDEPSAYQNLRDDMSGFTGPPLSLAAGTLPNAAAATTTTSTATTITGSGCGTGQRRQLLQQLGRKDSTTGLTDISEQLADRTDGENSVDGLDLSGDFMGSGDPEKPQGEEYDLRTYTPLKHNRVSSPNLYSNQPASFV